MPSSRSNGSSSFSGSRVHGVLGLQGGNRVDGVGAADRGGAGLGQSDVTDLALDDQLGQRADGVLDGRAAVDPVLVVQVDVVGAESGQRAFDRGANVGGAAVDAGRTARVGEDTELRRPHHLVAAAFDGATDQLLAMERSIDLGGVDVGDSQLERPVDGSD